MTKKPASKLEKIKNVWSNHQGYLAGHSSPVQKLQVDELLGKFFCPGPFFYYIMDSNTLTFETVSESMRDIIGIAPEDATLGNLIENIHPEDIPFMQECEHRIAHFLQNSIPPEKIVNYKVAYCLRERTKSGQYKLFLMQTITLQTTSEGSLLKVLGVHTDISHFTSSNNYRLSLLGMNGESSYIINDLADISDLKQESSSVMFTPRELEVVKYLGEGYTAKEVANVLNISTETVIGHRKKMAEKSGTKNTAELVAFCIRNGYI